MTTVSTNQTGPLFSDVNDAEEALDIIWCNSMIGLAVLDESGKFLRANPVFCKITGYNESELQERTFQQITHPDDLKADVKQANQVSHGDREEYGMLKRYITKTGKIVWIALKVNRMDHEDGSFKLFVAQVSDSVIGPAPETHQVTVSKGNFFSSFKSVWGVVAIIVSAVAVLIAEVIKLLTSG